MSHRCSSLLKRSVLLCAAAVPLMLLAGCSNIVSTAPADNSLDSVAGISGIVHGGRQPIIGATVTLWAAGNAGYGSTAASLASTTTDSNGNFSFHPSGGASYSCPSVSSSTESQYIYITSSGGQPTTGVSNSYAALMLALGNCSTVLAANPSVVVNEVTTVASMFALQQFFSPSVGGLGNFGTNATNINGLANAFATVNNLANINSGTAYTTTSPPSNNVAGYTTAPTVTITPEQNKINTLANILAACVNSSGSGTPCSTLFSDVNSTAALDTLQSAYYLAVNPTSTVSSTSNITAIYNTGVANSPFQPSLSATPTDWTIGVSYASTSAQTSTTNGTVDLLSYPTYPAVDAGGDVWWINANTGSGAGLAGNSITEMNPTGMPLAQALSSTTVTTAATSVVGGHGLVIDPSGNVWVANFGSSSTSSSNTGGYQNNVLEYNPTSAAVTSYTVGYGPTTLASDGAGNIFVADTNVTFTNASAAKTTGSGVISKIPAGGGTVTTPVSGVALTQYGGLALDSNYNLWLTSGGTTTAEYLANVGTAYSSSNSVTTADPEPLVIDSSNNAWIANYGTTLNEVGAANAVATLAIGGAYTGGGLAKAELAAIDGAGDVWVTNYTKQAGNVSEFSHSGTPISPATTGFAKSTSYWYGTYGIAIDASGNVWVGNFSSPTFYTEIVGQAVPVVTPLAAGLPTTPGGTSKLGTRP